MPCYLRLVLRYPAQQVAPLLTLSAVGVTAGGQLASYLHRFGPRAVIVARLGSAAVSFLLLARLGQRATHVDLLPRMLLDVLGFDVFSPSNNRLVLNLVKPRQAGSRPASNALARPSGQRFGASLAAELNGLALESHGSTLDIQTVTSLAQRTLLANGFLRAQSDIQHIGALLFLVGAVLTALSAFGSSRAEPEGIPVVAAVE